MKQFYFLLFSLFFSSITFGQANYWTSIEEGSFTQKGVRHIIPNKYKVFQLDISTFKNHITNAPLEYNNSNTTLDFDLPMPDGSIQKFAIVESSIMEEGLEETFPEIKTYLGQGITNPRANVRFGWTYKGFHAIISDEHGKTFIDPYSTEGQEHYIVYAKKDFSTNKRMNCLVEDDLVKHDLGEPIDIDNQIESSGSQLRTYRIAIATTGEYASFHGGTKPLVMSELTVLINRINSIYEIELDIRFIIISNNDQLIYLNGSTDPFNNNDAEQLINQSQSVITNTIGTANFDIGHTVSTGGGGLANFRAVCKNNSKAGGITGLFNPVNDPFYVDYVAHEIGHQFGGSHTFNGNISACGDGNRSESNAYEPGSGSTIMAYAGICGNHNLQSNSDPYFHTRSFDEIQTYITILQGNNCPVITNTGNSEPIVNAGTGGFYIPKSTPFELTGSATDPDGHPLTYCWEQFNLGDGGHPNQPVGNAPIFRSFNAVTSPSRTFPKISNIVNNSQTIGEILPSYGRTLRFRMTARDNQAGGGGVNYDVINFSVANTAGPFLVTEPNTNATTWMEGVPANITWDVAGTNAAPVNCANVDILLSMDGGYTYPVTLATNVTNNGTYDLIVPQNTATTTARVRVQCSSSIFFDISNQNFIITAPPAPTYLLYSIVDEQSICASSDANFTIDVLSLLNYSDAVNISAEGVPTGLTLNFNNNPVTPGNTLEISATNTDDVATGTYPIELKASSASEDASIFIYLTVYSDVPTTVAPVSPLDGASDIPISPRLTWDAGTAPHTYDLQVSDDASFSNLIVDEMGLTESEYLVPGLNAYSIYYWRVRANNQCLNGEFSEIFTFRTAIVDCATYGSGNTRVIFPNFAANYTSTFNMSDNFEIVDINVKDLQGTHTRMGDLTFTLESPQGTRVELFSRICGNSDNFDINLDDEATNDNYPCPPTNGGTYQPQEQLAVISGEMSAGAWVMRVNDAEAGEGGSLNNWYLELCKATTNSNEDPIIITNVPLEVVRGGSENLTTEVLLSTDADNSASDLVYTLISATSEGNLLLNGAALIIGQTFLQTDIDAGNLSYEHNEAGAASDEFRFHVEDGIGGWAGSPAFTITVLEDTNPFDLGNGEVWIYPNPTTDLLNVSLRMETAESVSFRVYDTIGQEVLKGTLIDALAGTNNLELNTTYLVNGVYVLVIEGETFNIAEKIVVARK